MLEHKIRIFLLSGRATSSSVKLVIPLPKKGKSRTIIVYVWPLNIYFRQTSNFLPETVITIIGFQCLQNLSLARNKRKHSKFYLYKLTHVTSSGMYKNTFWYKLFTSIYYSVMQSVIFSPLAPSKYGPFPQVRMRFSLLVSVFTVQGRLGPRPLSSQCGSCPGSTSTSLSSPRSRKMEKCESH